MSSDSDVEYDEISESEFAEPDGFENLSSHETIIKLARDPKYNPRLILETSIEHLTPEILLELKDDIYTTDLHELQGMISRLFMKFIDIRREDLIQTFIQIFPLDPNTKAYGIAVSRVLHGMDMPIEKVDSYFRYLNKDAIRYIAINFLAEYDVIKSGAQYHFTVLEMETLFKKYELDLHKLIYTDFEITKIIAGGNLDFLISIKRNPTHLAGMCIALYEKQESGVRCMEILRKLHMLGADLNIAFEARI